MANEYMKRYFIPRLTHRHSTSGEDVKKLEPSHIAPRIVRWWSHFRSLAVPQKFKQLPYDPTIPLRHIPKRTENRCPHKNIYMNVHDSSVYNMHKMENSK